MVQRSSDGGEAMPEPLRVAGAFLRALGDPEGGLAFLELHAADAPVPGERGLQAVAQCDAAAFACRHREISARGHGVLPVFGPPRLLQLPDPWPAAGGVLWLEVLESRTQRCLTLAVGLTGGPAAFQVGWCTVAGAVQSWTYAQGLLHSLADYPWMRSAEPAAARALLDAAYFRNYWRSTVKFSALPDARFSCQMSTACCRHDFEIALPADAQLLIDAMPWETLQPALAGTRLPLRPDGQLQLKSLDETCRFLGARNQCLIHQVLGRQPFGPCAVFPFAFAETPEGIAVSLSPICGSTRLGLGVAPADREDDLRERLLQSTLRTTDAYRLAPDVDLPWESFRDIEKALRDCLAADRFPMRRRLYVGTRVLEALRNGGPMETELWLKAPLPEIAAGLRDALRGMLARILTWNRATLRRLPREIPTDLSALEIREAPVLTRIFHNILYSKTFSYPYDLTTAFNLVIVLYLVALVMQEASKGPLTDAMWQELGSLGVHGQLREVLHDGVPDGFRALFGTSEFGQWVLAV